MKKIMSLIMFFFIISVPVSFAQNAGQQITIETDKTAYNEGDVITITGSVTKVISGLDMSIQVFSESTGSTNLAEIAQVSVTDDGKFTKTFVAKGSQWQNEGTGVIKAVYGQDSTELSVKVFKNTGTDFKSDYEVLIPQGGTFDVNYTLKGGIIESMELNPNQLSLDIAINTDTNGALNLQIPRDSIDAVDQNGFDEKFIVMIYASNSQIPIQTQFSEIETTIDTRSLYIPIKDGDVKIQIIGTKVIPEFGTMIQFILVIAIITVIIITARSRQTIFLKH